MKSIKMVIAVVVTVAALGLASCSKTSQEEKYLTSGTWISDTFGDDMRMTFADGGGFTLVMGSDKATGSWSYSESNNTLSRSYNFGNGNIKRSDKIKKINNSELVLESIDYGTTDSYHKK